MWDSFDDNSRHLWRPEAIIERSPDDSDLDAEGKYKDGSKAPLVLTVQQCSNSRSCWSDGLSDLVHG